MHIKRELTLFSNHHSFILPLQHSISFSFFLLFSRIFFIGFSMNCKLYSGWCIILNEQYIKKKSILIILLYRRITFNCYPCTCKFVLLVFHFFQLLQKHSTCPSLYQCNFPRFVISRYNERIYVPHLQEKSSCQHIIKPKHHLQIIEHHL